MCSHSFIAIQGLHWGKSSASPSCCAAGQPLADSACTPAALSIQKGWELPWVCSFEAQKCPALASNTWCQCCLFSVPACMMTCVLKQACWDAHLRSCSSHPHSEKQTKRSEFQRDLNSKCVYTPIYSPLGVSPIEHNRIHFCIGMSRKPLSLTRGKKMQCVSLTLYIWLGSWVGRRQGREAKGSQHAHAGTHNHHLMLGMGCAKWGAGISLSRVLHSKYYRRDCTQPLAQTLIGI